MRIEDIMSTDVATVRPGTSLKGVARLLVERGISGVPVVSEDGELVGVVSEGDLLPRGRTERRRRRALAWLLDREPAPELPARTAADVMSSPAVTIEPFWTIPGAAALMRDRGVKRLPVVRAGRLAGIVSRADIVRAFARSDEEIEREIRELVAVRQAMWSDQHSVLVRVKAGETTLSGIVERRSAAEAIPGIVAKVPGVVSVESRLEWEDDDLERELVS